MIVTAGAFSAGPATTHHALGWQRARQRPQQRPLPGLLGGFSSFHWFSSVWIILSKQKAHLSHQCVWNDKAVTAPSTAPAVWPPRWVAHCQECVVTLVLHSQLGSCSRGGGLWLPDTTSSLKSKDPIVFGGLVVHLHGRSLPQKPSRRLMQTSAHIQASVPVVRDSLWDPSCRWTDGQAKARCRPASHSQQPDMSSFRLRL